MIQLEQRHTDGRAYYERRLADGKTRKEAIRALKRHSATSSTGISPPTPSAEPRGPGRTPGHGSSACVTGFQFPRAGSSARSLPDPTTTLRPPGHLTRARPGPAPWHREEFVLPRSRCEHSGRQVARPSPWWHGLGVRRGARGPQRLVVSRGGVGSRRGSRPLPSSGVGRWRPGRER